MDVPQLNLVPYKHKYLKDIHELHTSQKYAGISNITTATLPKIGYLVYIGDQPIACGFLRRVEPYYGQIDTLASNAFFGSNIRHEAIKLIVDTIIDEAKHLKLKGLICHTSDAGVLARAQSIGFHVVSGVIIAKPL